MREEILARYRTLRRRYLWTHGLDLFLEAAFILTLTAAAVLLVDRVAFEIGSSKPHLWPWTLPLMLASLVLAVLLAIGKTAIRRISPARLALWVDRRTAGEERFLSAVELVAAKDQSGFALMLLRDAVRIPVEPKRIFPMPPLRYRWGIVVALLSAGILYAAPPILQPPPYAGFEVSPEGGPAPLEIALESTHQGYVTEISWEFGDGASATGVRAGHRYERPGEFVLRQQVRGPGGSALAERRILVLPRHAPYAAFEADPDRGRAPLVVRFRNSSRNAEHFRWAFGDGVTSTDAEPHHTFHRPGEYTVTLRAQGSEGAAETTATIRVLGEDAPLADFRAYPRRGPPPLTVDFDDLSTGKIESRDWDLGDLYAGKDRFRRDVNPRHTFRFPGKYTITLRVRGPGGEDREEKKGYIIVEDKGPGGGGGGKGDGKGSASRTPSGAGKKEGRLFGPKTRPREVKIDPTLVTAPARGGEKTVRDRTVYSNRGDGSDRSSPRKVVDVFPRYERTAEETLGREHVPDTVRDYVRRYFNTIRPR